MNIHLDTGSHEFFLSKLLNIHPNVETYLSHLLKTSTQVRNRDDFNHNIQSLWNSHFSFPINPIFLAKMGELLRLTGLLSNKYYKSSILGTFFLAYNLEITSFLRIFQPELSFMLNRPLSSKISFNNFQSFLIASSIWYIRSLRISLDQAVRRVRTFLEVLCLVFNMGTDSDLLKTAVRPIIMEYLKEQRLQFQSRQVKYTSISQLRKEPFLIPKFQHRERGLVFSKVLTDIYDWMTEYTSFKEKNQLKNYDPPYFDILIHAKKATVSFKDEISKKDRVRHVSVSQYTRTVTWILKREITTREKKFLMTTRNLQSINTLGMNALELIDYIREHLIFDYIKIRPNKKRRVLVFLPTSNLADEWIKQQIRKMDFTCGCCIYLAKHTKIDCLFFKKLEYFVSLGYITIPNHLRSLYTERIKPIFSTKVSCPFLKLKKTFIIQLKTSKMGKSTCIACLDTFDAPSPLEAEIQFACHCKTLYTVISPNLSEKHVFRCQLGDHHSILPKLDQFDRHITTLRERDYQQSSQPELPPSQVLQPKTDNLKVLFTRGTGYIHISGDDSIVYNQDQQLIAINQTPYQINLLKLVDTEKWNPSLQKLSRHKPSLEFIYRSKSIILSREDKVTIKPEKIPILQIKRRRKKEREIYPLHQLQTVYNVGKPRLNKIFEKWGVKTINSSTKGISKKPTEKIKEAMKLPGVQQTFQQLHIQGLMISHMNAIHYLMDLVRKYEKGWLAERYKSKMNKILPRSPIRLKEYYDDSKIKNFRQVSALEAWFSRPFAEGVRQFITSIQSEKQLLIQRPYGRSVARHVNKKEKQGVDYLGGYTSFDTTLNCVNRRLRHQLRIWNAKMGLGFHTIPLFVHTTSDKAGRAGHLDLEEVGRIVSQLTLCETIAEGYIKASHFQKRYDDDKLPYYVPKEQLVRWLRGVVVKKKIFTKKMYYNNHWMAYEKAHKLHVQNLCSCLEKTLDYADFDVRVKFLRKDYRPLIFHPYFNES